MRRPGRSVPPTEGPLTAGIGVPAGRNLWLLIHCDSCRRWLKTGVIGRKARGRPSFDEKSIGFSAFFKLVRLELEHRLARPPVPLQEPIR